MCEYQNRGTTSHFPDILFYAFSCDIFSWGLGIKLDADAIYSQHVPFSGRKMQTHTIANTF